MMKGRCHHKHNLIILLINGCPENTMHGCRERERDLQLVTFFSSFQNSFVNHGFLVNLVATFFNKIKQLLQITCPWIKNVIAVLCSLEADYSHGPVNLCHQWLGYHHIRKMLFCFLKLTWLNLTWGISCHDKINNNKKSHLSVN